MTIISACGWEAGHKGVWNAVFPTNPANTTVGGAFAHTGNYGLRITIGGAGNTQYRMEIPGGPDTVYMSAWIMNFGGISSWFGVRLGDGIEITFRVGAGPTLDVYVNAVKVADGGLPWPVGWRHFQAYIHVADAGQIMTRIDGYNDINYSGDTKPGVSDAMIQFILYVANSNTFYVDDLVFDNAAWLGDVRIEGLVPNGVGDVAQWSPSPGVGEANWEDVDEVPPDDDTTYVYVGLDGRDDLYNLVDWVAAGNVPVAVVQYARGKKMSVDATAFQFLAREGAATEVSGLQTLTTSYKYFQIVLNTKPSGGAWTDAAIDALQGGQRSWI